jgi:hypothetical protein
MIALAAGVLGALHLVPAIAPDLPGESDEPGVVQSTQSIFGAAGWSIALSQLGDQLGDDQRVISLHATPTEIELETSDEEGLAIEEIPSSAPYLIAYQISQQRPEVRDSADLESLEMEIGEGGRTVWIATLDPALGPPRRYRAVIPEPDSVAFEVSVRPLR